jgi:hypothetical protein
MKKSELEPLGSQPPEIWQEVKQMKNFEMLDAFQKGTVGKEKFAEDLRTVVSDMMECVNEMLERVPESVLMDMSILSDNNSIELSFDEYRKENEPKYVIEYFPCGDELVVATANESEEKRLDTFKDFLNRRYKIQFHYVFITFDEKRITLVGEHADYIKERLLEHLKLAFPGIEFVIHE